MTPIEYLAALTAAVHPDLAYIFTLDFESTDGSFAYTVADELHAYQCYVVIVDDIFTDCFDILPDVDTTLRDITPDDIIESAEDITEATDLPSLASAVVEKFNFAID